MTPQLLIYGTLGVLATALAVLANRRLFVGERVGSVSMLEGAYYAVGLVALVVGWYFNVRYTHDYGDEATYVNYTKTLFDNAASASAAQDFIIVNVALLPLWTLTDGRRRGIRAPGVFFVMSLFTSLAFAMALYLAFAERQLRHDRAGAAPSSTS